MLRRSFTLKLTILGALALGACGKSESEQSQAAAGGGDPMETAAEMAFRFEPGQYRTTISFQKIEVPGMPAAASEQMKAAMSKSASSEHCITPESAAKGVEAMKEHMGKGQCKFEKFDARGGKVDTVFSCQVGEGMAMRAVSQGTYTPTGSKIDAKVDMTGPGGGGMHLEQTMTTTRIGNCS